MANIAQLPGWQAVKDITSLLGAGANTVTSAQVYKFGRDTVIQLNYSNATVGYIFKVSTSGRIIVGGADNTTATGTEITWQS